MWWISPSSSFGRSHLTQKPAHRPKLAPQVDFLICIAKLRVRERRGDEHWEAAEDHPNRAPLAATGETQAVGINENALDTLTQARVDHMNDLDIVGSSGGGRGGLGLGLSGMGEARVSRIRPITGAQ